MENVKMNINIIFVRHATSCANIINKGVGKGLLEPGKWAPDSDISRLGIQECLQLGDFLESAKLRGADYITGNAMFIDEIMNPPKKMTFKEIVESQKDLKDKPLLLFACSEIRRTAETLYTSFLRYLPEYFEGKKGPFQTVNDKIIVLPWLNEERAVGGLDKDNEAEPMRERHKNWELYLKNLRKMFKSEDFLNDIGNDRANMIEYMDKIKNVFKSYGQRDELLDHWTNYFYMPKSIYSGVEFKDKREKIDYVSPKVLFANLRGILYEYLKIYHPWKVVTDLSVKKEININLVMVGHSRSGIDVVSHVIPRFKESFDKQQIINCEIIKLPHIVYDDEPVFKIQGLLRSARSGSTPLSPDTVSLQNFRLFPFGFYHKILKIKAKEPFSSGPLKGTTSREMYRYYLFYASKFNFFFSLFNVIRQKMYVQSIDRSSPTSNDSVEFMTNSYFQRPTKNKTALVEIDTPLIKLLNMPYSNYLKELKNIIYTLERLRNFFAYGEYFYDFQKLYVISIKNYQRLEKDAVKYNEFLKKSGVRKVEELPAKMDSILASSDETNKQKAREILFLQQRLDSYKKNPKALTIQEVFGLDNLHKYFFDGCNNKIKYLCEKCIPDNKGEISNQFTAKSMGIKYKPFLM